MTRRGKLYRIGVPEYLTRTASNADAATVGEDALRGSAALDLRRRILVRWDPVMRRQEVGWFVWGQPDPADCPTCEGSTDDPGDTSTPPRPCPTCHGSGFAEYPEGVVQGV